MNLAHTVARRYLFSHKGTHFINIISGVTILGLSIGSAALILVLSVFNGFEALIASMINSFNPDLKVVPVQGKYFTEDAEQVKEIAALPGVAAVAKTISETAVFEYDVNNNPGTVKGVDANYTLVNSLDSAIIEGQFMIEDEEMPYAVLGAGMARNLSVDVLNVFHHLSVLMPDRQPGRNASRPYKTKVVRPAGVFSIQQDLDNEFVLVPLDLAQSLLDRVGELSALEIKVTEVSQVETVERRLQELMGDSFDVLNRYEQDEEFMKLMNIEKWMAFAIASLMIVLIAFNLVGCLWMVVLDKKKDVAILKAMGSTSTFIKRVFLHLGLYYTLSGLGLGLVLGLLIYVLQKQFGIVTIPQGFVVDTYPIMMQVTDVLVVCVTVLAIGLVASLPAAHQASKLDTAIRQN